MIRLLLLADTHLGFDFPFRPRIKRRRRGPEFFANYKQALQPALEGRVDCVVHGGDLLYRSKVPHRLVEMALEPLKQVANKGTPVYLVPGNHERSAIPHGHLARHPHIHIFDRPRTHVVKKNGFTLALAGFPFVRQTIRQHFSALLAQTGWQDTEANGHLLCIHQAVDGTTVGPSDYTFRYSPDVINISEIPAGFCGVLAGHIHRFQVLTKNLNGKPLPAPVFFCGSIDRTSFAEKNEKKGYLILEFETDGRSRGKIKQWSFQELPTRPMIALNVPACKMTDNELESWINASLEDLPEDSIVKLIIHGKISEPALALLSAPSLRTLAPETMNINVVFADKNHFKNFRPGSNMTGRPVIHE